MRNEFCHGFNVMAAFMAAIHVFLGANLAFCHIAKDVDGRATPGHDGNRLEIRHKFVPHLIDSRRIRSGDDGGCGVDGGRGDTRVPWRAPGTKL